MNTNTNPEVGSRITARLNDGRLYSGIVVSLDEKNGRPVVDFDTDRDGARWCYTDQIVRSY